MQKTNALKKLAHILGIEIKEAKKFVDKEHPFLVTLPDGLIEEEKIVVTKCPYKCFKVNNARWSPLNRGFKCLNPANSKWDGRHMRRDPELMYSTVQAHRSWPGHLNLGFPPRSSQ